MIMFDVRDIKTEKDATAAADELINDVIEIKGEQGRGRGRAVRSVSGDLEQLRAKAVLMGWVTVMEKLKKAFKVLKKLAMSGNRVSDEVWGSL